MKLKLVISLSTILVTAAAPAATGPACTVIKKACEMASMKVPGKKLSPKACVDAVLSGGKVPGVNLKPADVAACKKEQG